MYWEPGLELMPFSGRRVATVYDLSHLAVPESHPPARIAYLTRQIDHTLCHADAIVTISSTMRREIAAYAGRREADITVVPPAAATAFHPLDAAARAAARGRLGLPQRYILSVGTLEPRKNLERLVQAYAALPDALRREWPLVCVGAKGWNDASLSRELQRLEARGELLRLGYVAQQDLPLITASADLLAYPSLYEGFGMPVVEAMACGVPVLTSRHTAMHEITGESAFLVEPGETDSIHAALEKALEDTDACQRVGAQGIERAARYDWQRSAETLVVALRGGSSE
ncbi:MAG: glycosyltransferase family 1 protein, partial [Halomonas sp.]|uniref:glycosyltransferase family 4 protein n=1 Tax=Halomonas sp. TaxID=1486246 RepID=UPI00286FB6E8